MPTMCPPAGVARVAEWHLVQSKPTMLSFFCVEASFGGASRHCHDFWGRDLLFSCKVLVTPRRFLLRSTVVCTVLWAGRGCIVLLVAPSSAVIEATTSQDMHIADVVVKSLQSAGTCMRKGPNRLPPFPQVQIEVESFGFVGH